MKKTYFLRALSVAVCLSAVPFVYQANEPIKTEAATTVWEETDNISVGDLKVDGQFVGNQYSFSSNTYFTYDKTKEFGSLDFKFIFNPTNWPNDGGNGSYGNQFHFYNTWVPDTEAGVWWVWPTGSYFRCESSHSPHYLEHAGMSAEDHVIELKREAELTDGKFTGNVKFTMKIDDELISEYVAANYSTDYLKTGYIFVTGKNGNMITDINWAGNTVTFKANGENYGDPITTKEKKISKPATDPVCAGKVFLGWFDEMGRKFDFENDSITGNITLTAGFTAQSDGVSDETYFSDDNFTPVLRFSASSDNHIGDSGERTDKVTQLLSTAYSYVDASTKYNKLDAAIFVGDISDNGSEAQLTYWKNAVNAGIREGTEVIAGMGNHEFRTSSSASGSIDIFESVLGVDADRAVKVNGFWFISVSPNISNGEHFSDDKVTWLDEKLAAAAADTPNKPIFVMQHEHIHGTVYGSEDWGVTEFTSVLCKYPQVVDFSGHSHYPLTDPRSIWQGTFTALGTGTLHYYETGINGYKSTGVYPADKTGGWGTSPSSVSSHAEYEIVEVDANNAIRVIVYDLTNGREITRYGMRNIMDERKVKYSFEARTDVSESPTWTAGTSIAFDVNEDKATFTFPQATCSTDYVESYRIELYKGATLARTEYALSDYFFYPMPENISITLSYLDSETNYDVKIYAVNVWEKESVALEGSFKSGKVVQYQDVVDKISLNDLYADGGAQITTETLNSYKPVHFIPSEDNRYGSFELTLQLLYIDSDFQCCFNKEFNNDDLVWINQDRGVWFIKDNFHSGEDIEPGLHVMTYGRRHESNGHTTMYVKIDGVLIHELESDRTFTNDGYFSLNFNSCYAAGSRYFDISETVPTTTTPTFTEGSDVELSRPMTKWTTVGGALVFDSTSPELTFHLEDEIGALSEPKTFEGKFVLGTNGNFYHYEIKTNQFTPCAGLDGTENVVKIICEDATWDCANLDITIYAEEVLCDYDEISISDIMLPYGEGLYYDSPLEVEYPYDGTSETYSAVLKYYVITGDLNSTSEFRCQLGTIWSYYCSLWYQPGNFDVGFYSWIYSTRPSDRFTFKLESNKVYLFEQGTIKVAEGEWAGWLYTYLKIDGNTLVSFYAPANECKNSSYGVSWILKDITVADVNLVRNVNFMVDGEVYDTKSTFRGLTLAEPEQPTSTDGKFFAGWYTAEVGGERIDFLSPYLSEETASNLYARFTEHAYTVSFLDDAGGVIATQLVGEGGNALKVATPVKTGEYIYDFDNWYIKGTDQVFDFKSQINADTEVEARFYEHQYKMVYLVNGVEYAVRYYIESNPDAIIGGEPELPVIKGATGEWVYRYERNNKDIYVDSHFDGTTTEVTSDITLTTKFNGSKIDIADEITRYFLSFADTADQEAWLKTYSAAGGHEKQDVKFAWADAKGNRSYVVYFADNAQFENPFIVSTDMKEIDFVGIFVPGVKYFWKVVAPDGKSSEVDTFEVLNTPVRWISAGTVFNMRDLGGWTTADGTQRVAYEKIYRGGQLSLDQAGESSYMDNISFQVFNYLGMKTEIELRGDAKDHLNQFNEYENIIMVNGTGYMDIFKMNDGHKEDYRNVFAALADESNYPVYFHCSWGADRTGFLGFMINAVLGVPFEQLVSDFELTSFSYSGRRERKSTGFMDMYEALMERYSKGGTIQDAATNFLIEYVGVPASDIEAMKAIMLVDATDSIEQHVVTYIIDGEEYQKSLVFDGSHASSVTPTYFDRTLKYWTLNGEPYDITTPVTSDLTLVAEFEAIVYEDYDIITVRDIVGVEEIIPSEHAPYTYEGSASNGSRMFVFDYEINVGLADGVHVEIAPNMWEFKAHVWIASSNSQHIFISGNQTPNASLKYELLMGHTYRIEVGVIKPLNGMYAGQKVLIFKIDGEVLFMQPCNTDISTGRTIGLAGTQGILHSIENKMTVTLKSPEGEILQALEIQRGQLLTGVNEVSIPEGKIFLGWFDEMGNQWNLVTSKVLKNTTLFARFGDKVVTAQVIDENGFEIMSGYDVVLGTKVGEIAIPLVDANKLEFVGWYDGDRELANTEEVTEEMNLICLFKTVEKPVGPVGPGSDTSDSTTEPSIEPSVEPTDPSEKGCKGSIGAGFGIVTLVSVLALAVVLRKKYLKVSD